MIRSAPLGYDVRMAGPALRGYWRDRGIPARPDRVASSYDVTAAPARFVQAHEADEPWHEAVDPTLFPDPFFETFGLFRSDRDALSLLAGPTGPDWRVYRYVAYWDDAEFDREIEPLGGRLRAMRGDEPARPSLDYALMGHDLLDDAEVSIPHLYRDDLLAGETVVPETFREVAGRHGLDGTVLVAIHEARHPYWFPDGALPAQR